MENVDPFRALQMLKGFSGGELTLTLSDIEGKIAGLHASGCSQFLESCGATHDALHGAALLKRLAGQVNVSIHALGILLCLPHILIPGEEVDYVSLGAGNTGRKFDLETNHRVAEFKFIAWRGGAESIRQNSIFKDFFLLAESSTEKQKYLYVLGTEHPLKFLNGGRALSSVLSKDARVRDHFYTLFSNSYQRVRDYYVPRKDDVTIQDVSSWLPELIAVTLSEHE